MKKVNLKKWRKKLGLSSKEAAERLEIKRKKYKAYEAGKKRKVPKKIRRRAIIIAKAKRGETGIGGAAKSVAKQAAEPGPAPAAKPAVEPAPKSPAKPSEITSAESAARPAAQTAANPEAKRPAATAPAKTNDAAKRAPSRTASTRAAQPSAKSARPRSPPRNRFKNRGARVQACRAEAAGTGQDRRADAAAKWLR